MSVAPFVVHIANSAPHSLFNNVHCYMYDYTVSSSLHLIVFMIQNSVDRWFSLSVDPCFFCPRDRKLFAAIGKYHSTSVAKIQCWVKTSLINEISAMFGLAEEVYFLTLFKLISYDSNNIGSGIFNIFVNSTVVVLGNWVGYNELRWSSILAKIYTLIHAILYRNVYA